MSAWINYTATVKILLFGLLVGAGLPASFALGVRLRITGLGGTDGTSGVGEVKAARRPVLLAISWAILTLVLATVLLGVLFIARDFIGHHTGWYLLGARPT